MMPVATVTGAVVLRLGLRRALAEDSPFLLLFAAVMASAAYGGLGPGLFATGLAAAAASFFLIPPFYRFTVDRSQLTGLGLFVIEGSVISVLSDRLHRAVRRASESERRVLEVGDRERARIGRDLHDGLGQQLLGASLLAKSAETRLAVRGSTVDAVDDVRQMRTVIGDALHWTRDLARQLTTTTMTGDGLLPALQDLAAYVERLFGVRCVVDSDVNLVSPPPDVCEHLYRLAQEATTNAVKHGHATQINLLWRADGPNRQTLEIRDDGRAPALNGDGNAGIGLHVMRYRAETIGGELSVTLPGPAGAGAVVRCTFPTPRSPAEAS